MPCLTKSVLFKRVLTFFNNKDRLVKQTISSKDLSTPKYLPYQKTSQLKASTLIVIDISTEIRRYFGIEKLGPFGFVIINLISRSCYKIGILYY